MNWGLDGGKYLFVMFDKKWMWGLVVRRYAKSCEKLGLQKNITILTVVTTSIRL
jgi:hypothetical protein